VFAVPLDGIDLGVMQLYRTTPVMLNPTELADALTFADLALELIVGADKPSQEPQWITDGALVGRAEVYQATGVLSATLQIGLEDALARLKFYAYCHDLPINDDAHEVISGDLPDLPENP
jgi:hypothetical protein